MRKKGAQFLRFIIPLLEVLKNNGSFLTASEATDLVIEKMNIPESEQQGILKNGTSRIRNQIAWARNYLVETGYLDSTKRGIWNLTEKGLNTKISEIDPLAIFKEVQSKYKDVKKKSKALKASHRTSDKLEVSIERYAYHADLNGEFNCQNAVDAKEKILRSVALRRGQPQFRQSLLKVYNYKCAISNCKVEAVLEAAHIIPYFGEESNHIKNGILLRSDLHLLFDRRLITVNADNFSVIIDPSLKDTDYQKFENIKIFLPKNPSFWPSQDALRKRLIDYNS